ncbi:MAG: hypothetical protein GYA85_10130, partial [Propionibacterium sp.]|nr:hypothetical protein [Propionibacterium sp.]
LLTDPYDHDKPANALVLMVSRGDGGAILPTTGYQLEVGDQLLIAGSPEAARKIELLMNTLNVLHYVRTGREGGGGWIWHWGRALKRQWIRYLSRH